MILKLYIRRTQTGLITEKDREEFETLDFDPDELLQLEKLGRRELLILMVFCGIRLYNKRPVAALTDDELRMAYVVWRADRIKRKKDEVKQKLERGMKWVNRFYKMATNTRNS